MYRISLSVIMPALNEEENITGAIKSTLRSFSMFDIDGEIIVINDGSTDGNRKIVEEFIEKNTRVRLINHEKPCGVGYSFWDGIKNSNKEVVVMFPGDNENDPENAFAFIEFIKKVDIIIPFIHNVEIRDKKRRSISSLYRFIINVSFGINLNYTNGTVFYRKCIFNDVELKSRGFFYQAELLVKLIRKGYLFAEVPNFLSKRSTGKSKAINLKSLLKVIKDYLKLMYELHGRRIEAVPGYRMLDKDSISYRKKSDYAEKIVRRITG